MRKFNELIKEQAETVVFTFGRFNPPTTGHEKLIKKVASVAGTNPFRIYPSLSQDPQKNPLPHSLKVAYMRKMFPRYAKNIVAGKEKTVFEIVTKKEDFYKIKTELEKKIDNFTYSSIEWRPLNYIDLNKDQSEQIIEVLSSLEELDDVQNIFTNANLKNLQS